MFDEMTKKMEAVLAMMKDDLNGIKTGRAKPSMVEQIKIEAYEGTYLPLVELASISAPDPHMLLIQPWDHSVLNKIERGLATSEQKLHPVVDGNLIRITIPPLTEESRLELVKLVKQKIESGKEMLRGIRNEAKRDVDGRKDESGVSEDDIKAWMDEMQKLNDKYMTELEEVGEKKEKELMEI
jgi:ribosome recycling factor